MLCFLCMCFQVINNACATQAIVSVLLNCAHSDMLLGDTLTEFREFSQSFDAAVRSWYFFNLKSKLWLCFSFNLYFALCALVQELTCSRFIIWKMCFFAFNLSVVSVWLVTSIRSNTLFITLSKKNVKSAFPLRAEFTTRFYSVIFPPVSNIDSFILLPPKLWWLSCLLSIQKTPGGTGLWCSTSTLVIKTKVERSYFVLFFLFILASLQLSY